MTIFKALPRLVAPFRQEFDTAATRYVERDGEVINRS